MRLSRSSGGSDVSNTVCAVVATRNRPERLRDCLNSLLAQTRLPDCILVVDNSGNEETARMMAADFPRCEYMALPLNAGETGAFRAGMQWMHCRHDFGWVWTLSDSLRPLPACLQTMLSWQHAGDLIQIRKEAPSGPVVEEAVWDICTAGLVPLEREVSFASGRKWAPVDYCDFNGALIRRNVIEKAELPDDRFFHGGGGAYGFRASRCASVIRVDYIGARISPASDASPAAQRYLSIRNRFLTWEHLSTCGVPVRRRALAARLLVRGFAGIIEAARSGTAFPAALQGLRDGLHGRFETPIWLIED